MSKTPRWNGFGRTLKRCAKGMLRYRVVHQTPLPEQDRKSTRLNSSHIH